MKVTVLPPGHRKAGIIMLDEDGWHLIENCPGSSLTPFMSLKLCYMLRFPGELEEILIPGLHPQSSDFTGVGCGWA